MFGFFSRKREQDGSQSKTAKDPICGMTVEKATALKSERKGQTYYFCSTHCQQTFESQGE
ncbi:YHS domain-containing protein [Pseudanabaena sp. PCC 6802]|uniref:YHS domain-containing protein n=1 Tax=Pseudanabaena sp. PCC 6802 TaxID=118173 RepID=UPI00034A81E1|nr:YHS domain-containing protein [Pseudanabaena sp. PCC 6802]